VRDLKRIRRRLSSIVASFSIFSISSGLAQLVDANSLAQLPLESDARLYTRTFKINPSTLFTPLTQTSALSDPHDALRRLLITVGIDLSDPARVKAFYNDRTEVLIVRASEPDLKLIENALGTLNRPPPLVRIEVKMAECPENQDLIQKLNWIKPMDPAPLQSLQPGPQVSMAILTEAHATTLLKQLQEVEGVDILTPPSITTISGRQARISVEDDEPVLIPPFHAPRKQVNSEINP
jgi:type II secretory pathway component GspD/PulD (secretin)